MQIKITMKCDLTPPGAALVKKAKSSQSWQRCGEKGALSSAGRNVINNPCGKYASFLKVKHGSEKKMKMKIIFYNLTEIFIYSTYRGNIGLRKMLWIL